MCARYRKTYFTQQIYPYPPIPTFLLVKFSSLFRFQYFSLIPLLAFAVALLLGCNCAQNSLIYKQAKALRKLKLEAASRVAADAMQK